MSRRRRGKMDWEWRRREEADQGAAASRGWLIGIVGRRFHCCLVFSCFEVVCFSFYWPWRSSSTTHTYKHNLHTYMQALGTPPEAGAEKWSEKGIHLLGAELFNLWLIIIWPHKGRGWGNSSVGLDCNLLCFSFPCRPMSGRSRDLTGVLDACTSDADPHCWSCCITWKSLMGKDCSLQIGTEQQEFNTHFRVKKVNVAIDGLVVSGFAWLLHCLLEWKKGHPKEKRPESEKQEKTARLPLCSS